MRKMKDEQKKVKGDLDIQGLTLRTRLLLLMYFNWDNNMCPDSFVVI